MNKVAIVYFSKTGVTKEMALSVAKGIESEDIDSLAYQITGDEIKKGRFKNMELLKELSTCQAIIFGSPTYMGGVAAQFKAFADATSELWSEQVWANKLAAGFTCGSNYNGDQTQTLQYMITLANQHGMLWVGLDAAAGYKDRGVNRLGCHLGASAYAPEGNAHEFDLKTTIYLGRRVAKQIKRFIGNK